MTRSVPARLVTPAHLPDRSTSSMSPGDLHPFYGTPTFANRSRLHDLGAAFPQLDRHFETFMTSYKIPGLAFGVIVDGELAHSASYGYANLQSKAAPTPDTVFRIASMTKSFTAMCILMLRDEGRLSLDDPAVTYVPELAGLHYPTSDTPEITVRSLLSMSSGLVEDDPWGDRLLDLDHDTFRQLLSSGIGFDLVPGTGYEYSNLGYAILGRIVSTIAGEPLRSVAKRRIFEPLGMNSTTWDADMLPLETKAQGYRVEDGHWVEEPSLADGAFGAMGGIATSISDLSKYVSLHLAAWPPRSTDDNGPLRRSSLREMAQLHRAGTTYLISEETGDQTAFFGYGFGLVSTVHPVYGHVVGHGGSLPGFASYMEWLPAHGVGVIVFVNRTYMPASTATRSALDLLHETGALEPRPLPVSPALLGIRDAYQTLYNSWDDGLAATTFLDTYFLDLDDSRRAPRLDILFEDYGTCETVSEVRPTGALRGSWTMYCVNGQFDITVMLGATLPAKVQFARISAPSVKNASPAQKEIS